MISKLVGGLVVRQRHPPERASETGCPEEEKSILEVWLTSLNSLVRKATLVGHGDVGHYICHSLEFKRRVDSEIPDEFVLLHKSPLMCSSNMQVK
ncbi:hypothetical protein DNTS_000386 [Danionella cerebrum]|uniref:Uncharacterized protein n=1 Tax=Danionella cerebrum TaxID=2873325 RepID=A0A553PWX6_9TELE|nr:hypothetical protein DNTS_000386 [Danionella translucida]